MEPLKLNRKMINATGVLFTILFTLIFITTNLVMVDFIGLQSLVAGQDGFMVLILIAILAYLYKNSTMQKPYSNKMITLLVMWSLYILSIFVSMAVADHFVFSEVLILLLFTILFLYKMKKELVIYIILAAILSIPSLLLAETTLNESGATLMLIYAAGFLIMPKLNISTLFYTLPAFALLLTITTSRTAILTFLIVLIIHLAYINLYKTRKKQKKTFVIATLTVILITCILFFRPLYRFFTIGGVTRDGIDWNMLTSTRYELWATVFHNRQWFGEGHGYFDFNSLLHAHNIIFDTLGRYGVITAVLFFTFLTFVLLLSVRSIKTMSSAVYIIAFIIIGMFEYSWLFMFTYFSPIILFFVIITYTIGENPKT